MFNLCSKTNLRSHNFSTDQQKKSDQLSSSLKFSICMKVSFIMLGNNHDFADKRLFLYHFKVKSSIMRINKCLNNVTYPLKFEGRNQ